MIKNSSHRIDWTRSRLLKRQRPKPPKQAKNIVETAASAGSFKTLVAAVKVAGLVDNLLQRVLYVFAPTDEAFSKLPAGTVESLLKPENKDQLVKILTYLSWRVRSWQPTSRQDQENRHKETAEIKVGKGSVFIDKAKVLKTDIATSNGVIH